MIEDYALIGDAESAALVGKDGSIDWLCLPRFDSGACFAALLGDERHGRWRIAPAGEVRAVSQRYRPDTLILETEFTTDGGRIRVTDFMPPRDRRADIFRRVEGLAGEVDTEMDYVLRFEYGGTVPWMRRIHDAEGLPGLAAIAGPDAVCLRGDLLPMAADQRHRARFPVRAGDRFEFSMTWYPSHRAVPTSRHCGEQLARTERYWRDWAGRCRYTGPYRDAVVRSLLTLKALTYDPTGGIVAAVTTSLPEQLGGERNWDYRYCWLRDAALTLRSLLLTGYREEARAWRAWLLRAVAGDPEDVQIMYGLAGERRLAEWTADWLPGYQGARPVRIGNDAYRQTQSDVYGEVLEALEQARSAGIAEDDFSWPLQLALATNLERHWHRPDHGIWEVRGPRRHFTHSRVMSWVAFDRAVRGCETYGLPGPVDRWRGLRDQIHDEVCAKGFDATRGTFTQYYGATTLDASLLQLSSYGFLPADDPRIVGTVAAVERELRDGPLVYRYSTEPVHDTPPGFGAGRTVDGLPPGEGAFLACSFWLARAFALTGRVDDAAELFEGVVALANDVGLLAEEYDPDAGCLVGNFPQAFSHLALVGAARAIAAASAARGS